MFLRRSFFKRKFLFYLITLTILYFMFIRGKESRLSMLKNDIFGSFHQELASNYTDRVMPQCDYTDIFLDTTVLSPGLMDGDIGEGHMIREGGEYKPKTCKPKFSVAVIIPYREQAEELRGLLVYLHTFLHTQMLHYRLYVVEQVDTLPFNKNELVNIGAVAAMKAGYPCLILHDVDLLPLMPANLYACTELPRCLSTNINPNSFPLFYEKDLQGVVAIRSSQFKKINGLSNMGYKMNNEDEVLYKRLKDHGIRMFELPPDISKYHRIDIQTKTNWHYQGAKGDISMEHALDGLSSLHYKTVGTVLHPLFTHIMVDLML